MHLLRFADLHHTNNKAPSIVTIGNFDGMHLGHQYIIKHVQQLAKEKNSLASVVCFEPQPKEFFLKDLAPPRITPFRDKIQSLNTLNIDQVLCLAFNHKLAALSPEDFVVTILVKGLNVKHIIVGDDFRFGYQRQGDFRLLQKLGDQLGFKVQSLTTLLKNNLRISSSHIRQLLCEGNFTQAKTLLGHPYSLSGRIHHGDENGRKIGFPTINIPMPTKVAVSGVYVVHVHIQGKAYPAMANIGIRPTVCGRIRLLETHIFNFAHDLYGQYVTIEFLHFVRSEKKFAGFEELKLQIIKDQQSALNWLLKQNLMTNEKV